jgi:hypothetical protein
MPPARPGQVETLLHLAKKILLGLTAREELQKQGSRPGRLVAVGSTPGTGLQDIRFTRPHEIRQGLLHPPLPE